MAGEPGAEAPKTRDDFVRNEENVLVTTKLAQSGQITIGRNDNAARALHRFNKHGRDGLGTFTLDDAFCLRNAPLSVGLSVQRTVRSVRMRSGSVDKAGQWQI